MTTASWGWTCCCCSTVSLSVISRFISRVMQYIQFLSVELDNTSLLSLFIYLGIQCESTGLCPIYCSNKIHGLNVPLRMFMQRHTLSPPSSQRGIPRCKLDILSFTLQLRLHLYYNGGFCSSACPLTTCSYMSHVASRTTNFETMMKHHCVPKSKGTKCYLANSAGYGVKQAF